MRALCLVAAAFCRLLCLQGCPTAPSVGAGSAVEANDLDGQGRNSGPFELVAWTFQQIPGSPFGFP